MKRFVVAVILAMFVITTGYAQTSTTGTPRTQSYLLQNEFQDGQPAGSITPQRMRDLIVSMYGQTNNNINLKNLGLPTGGDDTAAINSAIQSAKAAGVPVYAPAGTYKHSADINVDSVTFYGDGLSTVFQATDTASDCENNVGPCHAFRLYGTSPRLYNVSLTTTWYTSCGSTSACRKSNGSASCVDIDGTQGATNGFVVQGVTVQNCASAGIINVGGTNGVIAFNQNLGSLADGMHNCCGASHVSVIGNLVQNNGDDCYPVIAYAGATPVTHDISITGNRCSNSVGRNMVVDGGYNVTFSGNEVDGSIACIYIGSGGAYADATYDVTISGNTCTNVGDHGNVNGTVQDAVTVGAASGGDTYPVHGIMITGNVIYNADQGCVLFGQGTAASASWTTDITFSNNVCRGLGDVNSGTAITIAGVTNLSILNNTFENWGSGGIGDNATIGNAGRLTVIGNTWNNINTQNSGSARVVDVQGDTWTGMTIRDNLLVDGAHPPASYLFITGCGQCVIEGNYGSTAAQTVTGITQGHFFNPTTNAFTFIGLPTSCSGQPTGTLENVSGTLHVC